MRRSFTKLIATAAEALDAKIFNSVRGPSGEINWTEFTRKTGNPEIDGRKAFLREQYVESSLKCGRQFVEALENQGLTLTGDFAPGNSRTRR